MTAVRVITSLVAGPAHPGGRVGDRGQEEEEEEDGEPDRGLRKSPGIVGERL